MLPSTAPASAALQTLQVYASFFFSRPGDALHRPRSSAVALFPTSSSTPYLISISWLFRRWAPVPYFICTSGIRACKQNTKRQKTESHPLPRTLKFGLITGQNSPIFTGSDIVRSDTILGVKYIVDAYTHSHKEGNARSPANTYTHHNLQSNMREKARLNGTSNDKQNKETESI